MALLTNQAIDLTGLAEFTLAAAAGGGDSFTNSGRCIFVIDNADASPMTVTFNSLVASSFGTDENVAVTVTNAERAFIGPFQTARFNAIDGSVGVTYSGVTALTVAVLELDERGW